MLPKTVKNSNSRRVGRKKGRRFGQTYLRQKTHGRSSRAKSVILSGPRVNIICKHKQGAIENRPKMPTRRNKSWLSAFECFRYVLSNRVTGWWSFWAVSGAHAGAERTFRHTLPVEKDAESRLAWHNTQIHQAKARRRCRSPMFWRDTFKICCQLCKILTRFHVIFRDSLVEIPYKVDKI
jgi:hypothetical protein